MNQLPDNFVVIDLETSGLIAKGNPASTLSGAGILEVGAVDATGRRFYRRVALQRGRFVDAYALMCNEIDPLDLGDGVSIDTALLDLLQWLRADGLLGRWIMGGKNPQFDYEFLKTYWPKDAAEPLRKVISRRCVDLHALAYGYAMREGLDLAAEGFSTDTIYAKLLGMDPEPVPHNALRGALHEMEGFRRWVDFISRAPGVRTFDPDAQQAFNELMEKAERGGSNLEELQGNVTMEAAE